MSAEPPPAMNTETVPAINAEMAPEMAGEMLMLPAIPDYRGAPLPELYETARFALAECAALDECQQWADKAEALGSYARQAEDESLRKFCDRIQARAIRRCGELLQEIKPHKGGGQAGTRGGAPP